MGAAFRQGDVCFCRFEAPIKSRPVVVLSRAELNAVRENIVVALVTRNVRGIPLEVPVGRAEGLPKEGVASLGDIHTVPKAIMGAPRGRLSQEKRERMEMGLKLLFDLQEQGSSRP